MSRPGTSQNHDEWGRAGLRPRRREPSPQAVTYRPVPSRVNTIDRLTGRDRSQLPLTDLQQQTLAALTAEPARAKVLADRSGLPLRRVASGLLALSAKGLAVRTDQGWRLA